MTPPFFYYSQHAGLRDMFGRFRECQDVPPTASSS